MIAVNRREFLTASAAGVSAIAFPQLAFSKSAKPKSQVERIDTDRFELICEHPDRVRILQISDTHMGAPTPVERLGDAASRKVIRALIDEQRPDLVFHTGDFINNDKENVEHKEAIAFMNGLGTPWSLGFGNHDHSDGQVGGLSLDAYYARLENHAMGYRTFESGREYCFRIDVRGTKNRRGVSLFCFNCGSFDSKVVTKNQLAWFQQQIEQDRRLGRNEPILVMQHIPTVEYKTLYDKHLGVGRRGENVCFEQDKGEAFAAYRDSGRVRGIFCGHDHVNDYSGEMDGIRLTYGRVSGWSAYGDWQRGGRMIETRGNDQAYHSHVVLPKGVKELPEWSQTLRDA